MISADFLQRLYEEEWDGNEQFIRCHPAVPIKIFGFLLDASDYEIWVSPQIKKEEILPVLAEYLDWLAACEKEVTEYFCRKSGENLPEGWFGELEVYDAEIWFQTLEDFGATVRFGEQSVFPDHIVEFDMEKFEIVDDRLVG